jgi:SSS family solute:Na+ symporter
LFDAFIKVIGLFMGVLGGLFVLGALTRRANGTGAPVGAIAGAAVMFCLWKFTEVNGYLYTFSGITSCFCIGYLASLLLPRFQNDLSGLTVYTISKKDISAKSTGEVAN